jgi:hypothetical protein
MLLRAVMRGTDAHWLLEEAEALLSARRIEACLRALDQAESAGADADQCAGSRWLCWMLLGQMSYAWRESDVLRKRGAPDPHRRWEGSDFTGKRVLLRSLHGFGDAIQFIRYAPCIRQRAKSLVVEAAPRLVELLRCAAGVEEVVPWGRQDISWDIEIEINELPYVFRTEETTIPRASPYLSAPRNLAATIGRAMQARQARAGGVQATLPRIGLVWGCDAWNRSRMMPLTLFEPLLARRDACFYSLQGGEDNVQWTQIRERYSLQDASDYGDGLLTLASVMEHLDLVIAIDTMAAHMAGAMGKPVWLMLQHTADWRWMMDRADSPWYPTMRIFRQQTPGAWGEVIHAVSGELDRVCAAV